MAQTGPRRVPTRLFWDFRFLFFQSVKPSVSPLLTRGFAGRGRFLAGVRLFLVFVGAFFAIGSTLRVPPFDLGFCKKWAGVRPQGFDVGVFGVVKPSESPIVAVFLVVKPSESPPAQVFPVVKPSESPS